MQTRGDFLPNSMLGKVTAEFSWCLNLSQPSSIQTKHNLVQTLSNSDKSIRLNQESIGGQIEVKPIYICYPINIGSDRPIPIIYNLSFLVTSARTLVMLCHIIIVAFVSLQRALDALGELS